MRGNYICLQTKRPFVSHREEQREGPPPIDVPNDRTRAAARDGHCHDWLTSASKHNRFIKKDLDKENWPRESRRERVQELEQLTG